MVRSPLLLPRVLHFSLLPFSGVSLAFFDFIPLYSCFSINLGRIKKATKFYEGFRTSKRGCCLVAGNSSLRTIW